MYKNTVMCPSGPGGTGGRVAEGQQREHTTLVSVAKTLRVLREPSGTLNVVIFYTCFYRNIILLSASSRDEP